MGCHSFLQGLFPIQGSNLGLLHCRQILYPLEPQGKLLWYETRDQRRDKKKAEKIINILILKNKLLDNCWVKEEDIKKRWQEYKDLYKKNLNDVDNHDSVITHVEPDIVECEVK